ncbi:ABC transporter permease [uncultured Alsobacter sp.]|uniref:ABC transporter permease n=1 Tax=uncultured Alsobacter sp. TaxID=1748258 RepID=UPI0025DB8E34|nr:ABC transporter permease [uncultured Alsobacter sp.]
MIGFILRRLLHLVPVLLAASALIFFMMYGVPGGPIGALVGENATPEQIAEVTRRFGLDRPVIIQYFDWLWRALNGDLGVSLHSRVPVMQLIGERLPATLQLAAAATVLGLLIGIPIALASALHQGSWLDRILSGWGALALGVPTFWVGILLILLFAVELRLLPAASAYVPFWQSPLGMLRATILPAATLGLYVSGIFARFLRGSLIAELNADYVRTARSKGLSEGVIVARHVMRNALLPFITIVGIMLAGFIGGSVVTEAVFTYPGMGRLVIQAISSRDYPLIQGSILVILAIYILINLMVDVLYVYIDPRIDYD